PPRRPPRGKQPDGCPPCFNCLLPAFSCANAGECNPYDGQCRCPPGFGGQDCLTPLCGALSDGDERYPRPEGELCQCKDGWGGINCNDRKIIDTIPDNKPPQVTFSCTADEPSSNSTLPTSWDHPLLTPFQGASEVGDTALGTCEFQFWVDRIESFYCELQECSWQSKENYDSNQTNYKCNKIDCTCVPGRFLCGEDGSVNIDDFLAEEVKGPGSFNCESGKGCTFEEPAMNQLINDIFGDRAITLDCASGECLHYTQVPGYQRPAPPDNSVLVALSAAAAAAIFILMCFALWYIGHARRSDTLGVQLPEDEAAKLMTDHVPATLHFSNISYQLSSGKQVLSHITGTVRPGELLAIMGASGAGKSTLLDILARKAKTGRTTGELYVNGMDIPDETVYRRVTGYVDQEDTLLSTLTVYEAVLYSALLRLPRDMSHQAKVFRTLETMNELGILGIKDSRIGESGKRSISGGEKRRVSIACELVTGPSILFLDEPTSGLDSYNAYNVIESLKTLAKTYNRTVIFTIHQPQSNIVALFDRLLLLAKGHVVYSGESKRAQQHFEGIGHSCPLGYNIADYLIDLTVDAAGDHKRPSNPSSNIQTTVNGSSTRNSLDPENGFSRPQPTSSNENENDSEDEDNVEERQNVIGEIKKKAQQILGAFTTSSSGMSTPTDDQIPEKLASLVLAARASDDAKIVEAEVMRIQQGLDPDGRYTEGRDLGELRGYKKASWGRQFVLLSGRAFKNLYRNPLLMATHYAVAIIVALICGFFFYHVTNDIPGFQNRLGLFLFILSLFGFSCLSSLGVFANERMLFMRERANGYYAPSSYFASKVLFDMLPLRVIPPFVLGSIVYGLAGLNPDVSSFWKFIMTLVLFNLTASSIVLFLSVAVADLGVANLLGSLVMLYNLLFAGLLMNYDRVPNGLKWMQTLSFFHAGYEALLVNELRYLQLIEKKFGLDIQVPSATIFAIFVLLSYLVLEFGVKERR
ncbi:hypothetical protein TREMEDRAFT_31917, partial [Tremella mesenterica DSM 1558]|uniref:uncharacterized protein n=1 Tax=Tremella mesenterica (strain ATCC 24925 / CBS 8224 / DSM 1558 / NBRC 9311 / NRRL Y-6157 / RJB 2259-6 / UBC 559-6) TaxID=578456 RepID=UPI0003F4A2E2